MIWSNGKILPDDGLTINASDRTFEHGLGLFETLRTYNGRATLLDRHKARMLRSAAELNLPIEPRSLPDAEAVRTLLEAEAVEGDRMLRITASGGTESSPSLVWMRTGALPEPIGEMGASLLLDSWEASSDDLSRHKTLNYWSRRRTYEEARRTGYDEALSDSTTGLVQGDYYHEGSRSNLILVFDRSTGFGPFKKDRPTLVTPPTTDPIVPGIMRQVVLEIAGGLSIEVVADVVKGSDWPDPTLKEVFLTNSVRGIIPVRRADRPGPGVQYSWPAPGPVTRLLQEALMKHLWPEPS